MLNRLKDNWMLFRSIVIIFKAIMGRFYIFRDASDEIVNWWADDIFSEPPEGTNYDERTISLMFILHRQAKAEKELRDRHEH